MTPTPLDEQHAAPSSARATDIHLEREGHRLLGELSEAAEQIPWGIGLLQLAWTAGPVTYIAAAGGYYIGYGKSLPNETLVFFIGYTVLAGVVGLLANLGHKLGSERRQRARQRTYATTVDQLGELLFRLRDLELAQLEPAQRRTAAAGKLLAQGELSPAALALVVEELSDDKALAESAHRLELYRRNGLNSRSDDLRAEAEVPLREALARLGEQSPELASQLRARLAGQAPTLREGAPRQGQFIEHCLTAMARDNRALITLADVEALVQLCLELLFGRHFTLLGVTYRGAWHQAHAGEALEKTRHRYAIARAVTQGRIEGLVSWLVESEGAELQDPPGGRANQRLKQEIRTALDRLARQMARLRSALLLGRQSRVEPLAESVRVMRGALLLLRDLQHSQEQFQRAARALTRARTRWDDLLKEAPTLRTGHGRRGLRISEKRLGLDEEARIELAEALQRQLTDLDRQPLDVERARRLAIDLCQTLDQALHIARPEVQRAIDTANGAHFGLLEPGQSPATKIAHGSAMVRELHQPLGHTAERLAADLVRHYAVNLDQGAIDFLVEHYRADPELLAVLARLQQEEPLTHGEQVPASLPLAPLRPRLAWRLELERSERLLERFEGRAAG